jgi:DsbC/DsbD-like thiol-disulfide interchange protein
MRLALSAVLAAAALPAAAQSTSPAAIAEVALIEGWRQEDGSRLAAVSIRLAPGWHTYWRVPGDAGIPPSFDWSGSTNLASVAYEWPRPAIYDYDGIRTFGYDGTLVLPVRLTPRDPGQPLDLDLALAFGVCADVCVPAEATALARIAADAPPGGRSAIEAALAERAQSPEEAGVTAAACTLEITPEGAEVRARVTFAADPGPSQLTVLESEQPGLWVGTAESRTDGRTVLARAPIQWSGDGAVLERDALRVTVLDGRRAVDIPGCQPL